MLRFVINLDDSYDRWESMSKQLSKLGVKAQRISAVNGRSLPESFIQKVTPSLSDFSKIACPRELSRGEIGCYLSHKKCWQALVDSDEDWALIMEDDICFSERAKAYISSSDWIPKDLALVQLFIFGKIWESKVLAKQCFNLPNGDKLLNPLKPAPMGTQAYFISRKAALCAIKESMKLTMPVDEFLFSLMSHFARAHPVWRLNPAVITTTDFESTININPKKVFPTSWIIQYNPLRRLLVIRNSIYRKLFATKVKIKFTFE